MIVQPCPYCNYKHVSVEETIGENNRKGYVVCCSNCGMCGPESKEHNEEDAIRAWNYLCGKICRNCRQVYIKRIVELKQQLKETIFENKK